MLQVEPRVWKPQHKGMHTLQHMHKLPIVGKAREEEEMQTEKRGSHFILHITYWVWFL